MLCMQFTGIIILVQRGDSGMVPLYVIHFILFSHLVQHLSAGNGNCPPSFDCGNLGTISRFPFTDTQRPECGLLAIHGCNDSGALKRIQINHTAERWFNVIRVDRFTIFIRDDNLHMLLQSKSCEAFTSNYTLPSPSPLGSFIVGQNITFFRCNRTLHVNLPKYFSTYTNCPDYNIYYSTSTPEKIPGNESSSSLTACSTVILPVGDVPDANNPFTSLTAEVAIHVELSDDCQQCRRHGRGQCQLDSNGKFHCAKDHEDRSWVLKLGLGIGLPSIMIGLLILWHCKRKCAPSNIKFQSRNDPYSNTKPESVSTVYFGVPVFSYKDLEKATNNFDHSRELGNGGFGTVYHGKLRDGREVAVKRLYDNSHRRVEQFMNEIQILTRLRHRNLVTLYGCTSRYSRELLLVYEYIPNGTIASHLRYNLPKSGPLPWPIRMKVAIETATALAYLHASDIIHRDVKSSNILLDNSYCVKVADFGLSRLFPNDVTHVSTAPQGTPGYLDPEYYKCYQLNCKSDVYSFGVVLIELISSMRAVDMSRHRDEINLADLAINKIRKGSFRELVDPFLGFESNNEVKRMIVLVAELAFECLQRDRELRPSMDEVLKMLRKIESGNDEAERPEEADIHGAGPSHSDVHPPLPDHEEVGILKHMKLPPSPHAGSDKWNSEFAIPNVSI